MIEKLQGAYMLEAAYQTTNLVKVRLMGMGPPVSRPRIHL